MASLNRLCRSRSVLWGLPRYILVPTTRPRTVRLLSGATETSKVADGNEAKPNGNGSPSAGADNKELLEEKEKLKVDVKKMKDKYLLALAETENVRMRMNKQVKDAKLFSIQGFCRDLLEVADILNTATESVPKEELNKNEHLKNLFEGLAMTETQLQKVFNKHAIEQIVPEEGEKFDPYLHEAMFEVPSDSKEVGTIAVLTKLGYKLHNRTVRPAIVGVYKAP